MNAGGGRTADGGGWSLRRRMTAGLLGYAILLTLGILANDFVVNESAEHLAWESLLKAELDHFLNRRDNDPEYVLPETETLELLAIDPRRDPQHPLLALPPGIHDEIMLGDRERVILIRDRDGLRFVLALDISDLEGNEARLRVIILASALLVVTLLGFVAAWGAGQLIAPLHQLAERIGALEPGGSDREIALPRHSGRELAMIVQSMNRYIERNIAFVEREQAFSRIASHELRTPISIIAGAARLALDEPGTPEAVRRRLRRIEETTNDVNELVNLLLVLARAPERLADASEAVRLHELLPRIVADHAHLARGKEVTVRLGGLAECVVVAPLPLVRSAIGNLLRNAIENTTHGDVMVSLGDDGEVVIEDHGPGIPIEQIGMLYTRLARGEGLQGRGIGLQLIARLCSHLDWRLTIDSTPGEGTRMGLRLPR